MHRTAMGVVAVLLLGGILAVASWLRHPAPTDESLGDALAPSLAAEPTMLVERAREDEAADGERSRLVVPIAVPIVASDPAVASDSIWDAVGCRVRGRVVDGNDSAIPGALVAFQEPTPLIRPQVILPGGEEGLVTTSREDGGFELVILGPWPRPTAPSLGMLASASTRVGLRVSAVGFAPVTVDIQDKVTDEIDVGSVRLDVDESLVGRVGDASGRLVGRVLTEEGEPISGARIVLFPDGEVSPSTDAAAERQRAHGLLASLALLTRRSPEGVVTDADGWFATPMWEAGRVAAVVASEGFEPRFITGIALSSDPLEVRLTASGRTRLIFVAADGGGDLRPRRVVARDDESNAFTLLLEAPEGRGFVRSGSSSATVYAECAGFASQVFTVEGAPPGVEREVVLELSRGVLLDGIVMLGDGELPGPARVTATSHDPALNPFGDVRIVTTSLDGRFELGLLAPTRWDLVATLPDGSRGHQLVRLSQDEERRSVAIPLRAPAVVSGVVFDFRGVPMAGEEIVLAPRGGFTRQASRTDELGRYAFVGQVPGVYTLTLPRRGSFGVKVARLSEGEELVVDLHVPEEVVLRGLVLDGSRPLVHVQVALERRLVERIGFVPHSSTRTDEHGEYVFERLGMGTYRLTARSAEGGEVSREVEVTRGGDVLVDLALPQARLAGRVVDAEDGRAISGAQVAALDARGFARRQAVTDGEGRFLIDRREPGATSVRVSATGRATLVQVIEAQIGEGDGALIEMFREARLSGRVTNPSGEAPAKPCAVLLSPLDDADTTIEALVTSGHYRAEGLAAGRYRCRVARGGAGWAFGEWITVNDEVILEVFADEETKFDWLVPDE